MKKAINIVLAVFLVQFGKAQNILFTEVTTTPFEGALNSGVAFGDIDNDGDLDCIITGLGDSGMITELYENDGLGGFSNVYSPFDPVWMGSAIFVDINNDNDLDVFIIGSVGSSFHIAKLYQNDGVGNFSEIVGTPFQGTRLGGVKFADIDNDFDQDLLITGAGDNGIGISRLYKNDGSGNFQEVPNTGLPAIRNSSIDFADIDGDNDQDLLIVGDLSGTDVSKLYMNDGAGNFTEVLGIPFVGVSNGDISFADVDGNTFPDVLITGFSDALIGSSSKLYLNDGAGNYSEVIGTPFDNVNSSSIAFGDVDNDNDQDVLITGVGSFGGTRIAKLYENDGLGNYVEVNGTPFDGIQQPSVSFGLVNGDNKIDLLISGENNSGQRISKLYRNRSAVGLLNVVSEFGIKLFPVPTYGLLTIDFQGQPNIRKILIRNMEGKLIDSSYELVEGDAVLNLNVEPGIYFIEIVTDSFATVERVVKK